MATYDILSQDEQDDIIVAFVLAQEKDSFCHELNRERYSAMLDTLPAGPWRDRVTKLLTQTNSRLAEVNSIIEATKSQLPSAERMQAAKGRMEAAKPIV